MENLQTAIELYNIKFNEKNKALRKASDINQQELADKIQFTLPIYPKWKTGIYDPLLILYID